MDQIILEPNHFKAGARAKRFRCLGPKLEPEISVSALQTSRLL